MSKHLKRFVLKSDTNHIRISNIAILIPKCKDKYTDVEIHCKRGSHKTILQAEPD